MNLSHLMVQSVQPLHPRCVGYLSNALLHIVTPKKLASSIYILNISVICV
jgi:hypothetical protein